MNIQKEVLRDTAIKKMVDDKPVEREEASMLAKRPREKDDLAMSEGVQSFGGRGIMSGGLETLQS